MLGRLPSPIALIEVGASAGLCLFPDRYSYAYNDSVLGESALRIDVQYSGPVPIPTALPQVAWRAGVDLNPLDVTSDDDVAWLQACIWPEHDRRRHRLARAIEIAAVEPPTIHQGDLNATIDRLIEAAPVEATVVVWHSAVLAYLPTEQRIAFGEDMKRRTNVVWVSNEAPGIVDGLVSAEPPPTTDAFVLGLDGTEVLAFTDPHGEWIQWNER